MQDIMKEVLAATQSSHDLFLEEKKLADAPYEKIIARKEPLTAIDGGSAPLLTTPNACILFVRIIAVTMQEQKKVQKQEGFVVATFAEKNIQLQFHDLQGKKENLSVVRDLNQEKPLLAAANMFRKILEWRFINRTQGAVVWDGSFTTTNAIEEQEKVAISRPVAGLAKTTGVLGDHKTFFRDAPEGMWQRHAFDNTWFVKLHPQSKHVFRIDILHDATVDPLISWSSDPVFLGYPYPLILADQLARVSTTEAAALKTRLQSVADDEFSGELFSDAHEILDKMQF